MERKRDFSLLKNWRVLTLCGGCIVAGFLLGMLIFGSPWHLPPAWGDIPTWITGIATAGLLVGAIITARYAIKAFGKQSEQLEDQRRINAEQTGVLALQAEELGESLKERKREAEQRRSAQAARVFISLATGVWFKPLGRQAGLSEIEEDLLSETPDIDASDELTSDEDFTSDEPGGVIATVTVVNTSDQPVYDTRLYWRPSPRWPNFDPLGTIMPGGKFEQQVKFPPEANVGALLRFRDAAGITWTRTPDGILTEEQQSDLHQPRQAPSATAPPDQPH